MKLTYFSIVICTGLILFACKSKKETVSSSGGIQKESVTKTAVIVDVVEGLNLGNKAPEISMTNTAGENVTLSSLKGKLVLIDFWASWCGPCRQENPMVVKAYQQFHNSQFVNGTGFEILSVSLDNNKAAWIAAIEKDKLIWPYHISDLKFWDNAAAQRYGVNGIPTNFLINGDGIIIAKNLRGEALEKNIKSNLK